MVAWFQFSVHHVYQWHVNVKATRHNYTPEEKSALAELIGMVKSVQSQMFHLEPLLTRGIYLFIYGQLQDFMHCSLPEPLRKADKRHKEMLKRYLYTVTNSMLIIANLQTASFTLRSFDAVG